jgi:hypothetical protein
MPKKIKNIKRYNRNFKNFNFSNPELEAQEEYLETVIEMDANGNTLIEAKYADDNSMEEKNSYTYDANGKLLEHILLYAVEDVTEKRILKRNEKGKLITETKFYGGDSGEHTEYVYDDKDEIIERKYFDEDGVFISKEIFKYDDKGSLAEQIKHNSEDKIEERTTFKTLEDASIEQCEWNGDGTLANKTIIHFNKDGKESASLQTTADGKLISKMDATFDERGNVTERKFVDFYSKTVRYTYDEHNRCIEQELFDGNGMLIRKNIYEFDEEGNLTAEQTYEMDTSRGGRDKHYGTRYVYEFYEDGESLAGSL